METRNRILWEDVKVGMEIPSLPKTATTQMLVKWAGASGDFNPLHYDFAFASMQGFKKPIVHGQLKRAWLIQLIGNWMGEGGFIKEFSCQFRSVDYPTTMGSIYEAADSSVTHWCRGRVIDKYMEGSTGLVQVEAWVESESGERTTYAQARVILPLKRDFDASIFLV